MAGPMEGVKVVELGVWVAGPAAAGCWAWTPAPRSVAPKLGEHTGEVLAELKSGRV